MAVRRARLLAELKPGERADLFLVVDEMRLDGADVLLMASDPSGTAAVHHHPDPAKPVPPPEPGAIIKVRALVETAGRRAQLRAEALRLATAADSVAGDELRGLLPPQAAGFAGAVVAFDVETVAATLPSELPERERHRLLRSAYAEARKESGYADPVDEAVEEAARKSLALNPLTARIVSIAFRAADSSVEWVLVASPEASLEPPAMAVDERALLRLFWRVARRARTLVGFNSRRFDVPVLLTRSALLGVPAPVDLLAGSSAADARHIDILEVLSGRGAADRRASLELVAHAFAIPVKTMGHGSEVALLVEEERFDDLAAYNLEDARATAAIYEKLRGTWIA